MDTEKTTLYLCKDTELFYMSICYLVMENPCITIKRFNNDYKTLQIITQDSSEAVFIVKFSWLQKNVGADISQFIKDIRGISVLVYLDTDKLDLILPMFNQGVQGFFTEHITKEEFGYCLDELLAGRTFFFARFDPFASYKHQSIKDRASSPHHLSTRIRNT